MTSSSSAHIAVWLLACVAASSHAEVSKADASRLTLDRIFTDNEFKEKAVETVRWSKIAPVYFTLEESLEPKPKAKTAEAKKDKDAETKGRDLVRHDIATGNKAVLVAAGALKHQGEDKPLKIEGYEFSADESKLLLFTHSKKVWRSNTRGDYWLMDMATRKLRKLGGDAKPSTLMFAKFSPDGTRVAFVRENNLYVQDLETLKITTLTTSGSATRIFGTSDWVNEEELGIRDGFRWSPDGRQIALWQFDVTGVPPFHMINNTDGLVPKITTFPYPKPGDANSAVWLGVVPADGRSKPRWLQIPGDPRERYLAHMEWTEDGHQLMAQEFNRLQNTLRVRRADPTTGDTTVMLTESDKAWVENKNSFRWAGDGFVWLSERSGWRHAYLVKQDGKSIEPITQGEFDVIDIVAVDAKGGWLYYYASPENAAQRYLWRTPLQGGKPERLSPATQAGWHSYDLSPDSQWAVHTYSAFTTPSVVELVHLPEHQVIRVLEDNHQVREKLAALAQPACEFIRIDIGGTSLDAWCLKPLKIDASAKHPLLMHVYGEPAGQTVKDAWGGQKLLWHMLLAQQGFIVASVDNRGTPAPRGRDWRKCVYRQIGILAPQDQAKATQALLQRLPFADASRVGIWGWSGGGSMSLNAIFRHPDLYRTAIAVAPVADQKLYDTIYQERYMGLPKDNAEGYRLGSPITHAAALMGHLLIIHGTGDDNVHYQATEKLMNELIAQNKSFSAMAYPNRSHSINEGKGTTRHFYGLMTDYLRSHLLNPEPK